ncbi:hypothetical protein H2198_003502 [Neophaeococcomyces mojaviensis]|uniref:Uncharacterized protein n=1 Tax=Neophaeococcomyces mojaviensis TaxID=3383035 RepID=A0ACC3ABC7_9EURO|nr:hypothetical protein H2198_003502 [Knufia sp. JES_112]
MKFSRALYLLAVVLTGNAGLAATVSSNDAGPCPLLGPDFPTAKSPSNTTAIKTAIKAFQQTINTALTNASSPLALDPKGTTFSFEAWSIHEQDPLYTYHYDAIDLSNPAQGAKKVQSDTVYRLGSLSKLLTVYTFLATAGEKYWTQPITNFIPELEAYDAQHAAAHDAVDYFSWSDITIGTLASQLSGIQKDPILSAPVYSALTPIPGLPRPISVPTNATGLECDTYSYLPCTRSTYINSITSTHPVFVPGFSPVYSDMAYSLLAFALENITNTSFPEIFQKNFITALNLTSTSYNAPKDLSNAIIPVNDSVAVFTPSLSYLQPGGGFYSSLADVSAIGRSILSSTLLPPRLTHTWLKPSSFLSGANSAVGAPWEIYQPAPGVTNKTTWMYTKSGDLGAYSTYLVLFPDYDAGFTLLCAGYNASKVSRLVADIAATSFAPAFEAAAREAAEQTLVGEYMGTFPNAAGNGTDAFEVMLAVDNGPGLSITNYTVNGVDMRAAFAALSRLTKDQIQLRLYPSELTSTANGQTKQGFRMIRYTPSSMASTPQGAVFSSPRCQEWFNVGGYTSRTGYGAGGGLDEFTIVTGANGQIEGLEVKTWGRVLGKAK